MKQHYIPRCYLKRFSDNPKSIYAYDKKLSRTYRTSLMSVCCEDDLYTISDEYVDRNESEGGSKINRLSIEHDCLAKDVEPLFGQLLDQLDVIRQEWLSGTEHYRLNFYEKRELALHVVTQYFRMPDVMDATVDDYLRMERANFDMIKHLLAATTGEEGFKNVQMELECEKPVLHATLTYMDNETLMSFADAIAHNVFVFWGSAGEDFFTSDVPVAVEPYVENARPLYMGLAQYGGELMMPLSPGLALSVYDRNYFKDMEEKDCSFIIADDKEVRRQNMMRYFYAKRHVFGKKNDFWLIDFIYAHEGNRHIFKEPHLRGEIISGLGRY